MMRRRFLSLFAALGFVKTAHAEDEAAARKVRSEKILRDENVPVNADLPMIETVATSLRRSKDEVIERTFALAIVAVKGETGDAAMGNGLIRQFEAETFFSPDELAFMKDDAPSEQDRVQFTWRYEGAEVLLWALGIYEELRPPRQIADVPRLAATLRDLGVKGVRKQAQLRAQSEILDAADLIYRYDWAVVDARINNRPPPAGLEPGVVYERHYVLNWLIGYMGQEWDDVSTDT